MTSAIDLGAESAPADGVVTGAAYAEARAINARTPRQSLSVTVPITNRTRPGRELVSMTVGIEERPAVDPVIDRRRMNLVFVTVLLGMLLAALDQTIVSTALPTIVGDLGGAGHLTWVVSSYLLADTIATVLAGKFGDLFGRKLIFQVSASVFVLASAACGFANSMTWLIAWRAVQGIGAGGLTVTATALIADVIPLRERGKYQGALGAVFGVTTVLGPLVGGFFTDHLSWRWAFYVNLPIGIAVVVLAAFTIPSLAATTRPVIDYLGIVFVSLGTAGLTLALSWGGTEYPWGSATIIGLFVGSAICLAIFVFIESRAKDPILPLRLFRSSVFSVSVILAFIVGFAMLGAMTFLPTYLQYVEGVSATASGVRTLPMVVGLLLTSILSGVVVGRTGKYRFFPIAGTLVMAVGLYLLSRLTPDTSYWIMAFDMLVLGIGIGLVMQVLTIIVQSTVDYHDLGVATSGVTFFRTLGSSFGAAVFGTFFSNALNSRLPAAIAASGVDPRVVATPAELHKLPATTIAPIVNAYAESIRIVFLSAVPVALLAFVLALFLKQVPLRGTSRASATDVGEGFSMPEGADSAQAMQYAIVRMIRKRGPEAREYIMRTSGVTISEADGWCVWQVHARRRTDTDSSLTAIARRYRLPASVLAPAMQAARADGYVIGPDDALEVTDAGRGELRKVADGVRAWLSSQLEDWGETHDRQFDEMLDGLAQRFLDSDPGLMFGAGPELAISSSR
jgi:EmrB/QacA subfamily drug resistance transporter